MDSSQLLEKLNAGITPARFFSVAFLLCIGSYAYLYKMTYSPDPEDRISPVSAIEVSESELASMSKCAQDYLRVDIRYGRHITGSDAYYTEWKCSSLTRSK